MGGLGFRVKYNLAKYNLRLKGGRLQLKKINMAIVALTLLLAFLSYTAAEVSAVAQLKCNDLSSCCGAAGCEGPGTNTGCSISCQGGGSVTCCSNASGQCKCGGGGGIGIEE